MYIPVCVNSSITAALRGNRPEANLSYLTFRAEPVVPQTESSVGAARVNL